MANTIGEKELKRDWPITSGLSIDDKHEGRQINLVPKGKLGVTSNVREKERTGFD